MSDKLSCQLNSVPDLPGIVAQYPAQYPFLLDSAASGPLGRYSLLLRSGGQALRLERNGQLSGPESGDTFLDRLRNWYLSEADESAAPSVLPFCGGWFVYLGYELAGEIEPVLDLPAASDHLPVALAVRCPGAVIIKHGKIGHEEQETAYIVAETEELLRTMRAELENLPRTDRKPSAAVEHVTPDPDHEFTGAVGKIHTYLEEGDVFQVNLSRAWHGSFAKVVDPIDVYLRLKGSNPAPFAGLMNWEGKTLMSSSPERLVEVRGNRVQTRPIAGTYPRADDADSDAALSRDMLAHPKERAEHIMLIDLERNDLGRVCEAGSVEVNELMVVESYAHVHHIVSNVRGTLKGDATPADVIRAVFPGGTITGCPKVRCMQIIAELEGTGRGFYTGSMGYISRDGQMDINILIRSMLLDGTAVSLRTGAGIVMDSQAERELEETVAKAKGLLLALQAGEDESHD